MTTYTAALDPARPGITHPASAMQQLRMSRDENWLGLTTRDVRHLAYCAGVKVTAVHVDLRTLTAEWYTVEAPAGGGLVYQDEVTQ